MTAPRKVAGFSLVELMVALVAGMVVAGAMLAFTVSSVRANSDFVAAARLTQELRNTLDEEIRIEEQRSAEKQRAPESQPARSPDEAGIPRETGSA